MNRYTELCECDTEWRSVNIDNTFKVLMTVKTLLAFFWLRSQVTLMDAVKLVAAGLQVNLNTKPSIHTQLNSVQLFTKSNWILVLTFFSLLQQFSSSPLWVSSLLCCWVLSSSSRCAAINCTDSHLLSGNCGKRCDSRSF